MERKSLDEINGSVDVPNVYQSAFWQKFLAYSGPGALVAVGYMDPGNWLTSLAGGNQYRYQLLVVLFTAILIAMYMQSLAIKLGVTTRTDLAQAIARRLPTPLRIALWLFNEIAMMATDLTGVVGTAVALNMLFKLPLLLGVLLTIADVLVVLFFLHFGIRRIEFIVLTAILVVGVIFAIEVCRAHPEFSAIMDGFVPRSTIFTNHSELLISLGIVGATIMPHNIYLHSSLAQSRRYDEHDPKQVKETLRFANWDSLIHLFAAFVVNALLLILGGTLFFHAASLGSLEDVFFGLKNPQIVGSLASPLMSWLFAFALLVTGLISSITSTLAGQIVMEGFINIRLPLWKRRLLTRAVTLVPILIIGFMINFNEEQFEQLIIYAQIVLSIALPFTLYPLVALTGNKKLMGPHVNSPWQTVLGYVLASLVTGLNLLVLV
ncbi:Nramp family divalent metal transporter [Limosilactobacillus reuteri]|uniref:Nramp family divalent metal transporter n=1 Tax=Limosilactobacillus reuteri TaxID=1598 RepID=A0AAW6JGX4_LIMRT|nr:Nramp family divalent metal transporter [Limosilactobacillus reuteri]MDD1381929.1 Nramp family divalent metal transporter [Limosilactobacillus reuteri]MDD1398485.1 Nramp family divalent metal transporter [Limosilactobacillus reuteri]MDD1405359.1 Nramp family divalent metal transporter [Limosilactobacillus reuteri]